MTTTEFHYTPTKLMLPTSHYDARRADFAVNFISMLKHTTGEWYGKPFRLMPWQEQIIRDIFGIVDGDGSSAGKRSAKNGLVSPERGRVAKIHDICAWWL